jgi:RNA polymerase sigma factor (sigma-70 family)
VNPPASVATPAPVPPATRLEELVGHCVAGDRRAWDDLVAEFGTLVRAIARAFGLNQADADDVCQMTWSRAFQRIHTLREPDRFRAWLATLTRREALNHLRGATRYLPVGDSREFEHLQSADTSPEDQLLRRSERDRVTSALRELPSDQRELIGCLFGERAMSYDQISAALAMPRGSVGPTRARALRRLRQLMS